MQKLYFGNCLDVMEKMVSDNPNGLFDCIWTDPPYFLSNNGISCQAGKVVSVNKGSWDKSQGVIKNYKFNETWLGLCQKLLKPNGTIWVSGTHHVIYSIGFAMQNLGFKILNEITWEKPNPPPNLSCRYFTHSTENIIWAAKSEKSKHLFNYSLMRDMNNKKQMKTVWSFLPPNRDEKKYGKHPTQKPLKLIERCLLASTKENDLVFDPFMGSGTTGVASLTLNRSFFGIEQQEDFYNLAEKRISDIQPQILKIAGE